MAEGGSRKEAIVPRRGYAGRTTSRCMADVAMRDWNTSRSPLCRRTGAVALQTRSPAHFPFPTQCAHSLTAVVVKQTPKEYHCHCHCFSDFSHIAQPLFCAFDGKKSWLIVAHYNRCGGEKRQHFVTVFLSSVTPRKRCFVLSMSRSCH